MVDSIEFVPTLRLFDLGGGGEEGLGGRYY